MSKHLDEHPSMSRRGLRTATRNPEPTAVIGERVMIVDSLGRLMDALGLLKEAIDEGNLNLAGLITADIAFDTEAWREEVKR